MHTLARASLTLLCLQEFDVYSFGIMLYELYNSKPAFANMSAGDIIAAKLQNDHVIGLPDTAPQALQVTYLSFLIVPILGLSRSAAQCLQHHYRVHCS